MDDWKKRAVIGLLGMLGFTVIGAVFALPHVWHKVDASSPAAIMVNWWLWGLLTPVMVAIDARLTRWCRSGPLLLGAHAACAALLAALYVATAAQLEYSIGLNKWYPWTRPQGLLDWYVWALEVYCLILGALKCLQAYRGHLADELKVEQMERQVLSTRLDALRMQLDPQMVFDALSGISAHVEQQPKLARRMIEHLGDLLRMSLATRDRRQVSVAEEVAFLEHYIALRRLGMEERLTVHLDVTPDALEARIPALLLPPLLDNAIRHGIGARPSGGTITVSARRAGDRLEIDISDDGAGLAPHWQLASARRQGISITRERLLAMYPAGESSFEVASRTGGGTRASIALPYESAGEKAHVHAIH